MAARELFRQGAEDADAGRFADGLEKFKRVAAVKETAAVRFNIARCEEALGKTGTALADFELAAREGGQDAKAGDVAKMAADHADALRPKVPRLTVVPPKGTADGLAVSLDGAKIANATLTVALPVDPGSHVVDATAAGKAPFHAKLTLAPGETKTLELALAADAAAPGDGGTPPPKKEEPPKSHAVLGWGAVGLGAALAATSGVFLILERNAVSNVNSECPDPAHCPSQQQTIANQNESNARTYNGLSIGFIAAGGVAVVAGVVLLATEPKKGTPSVSLTTSAPGALTGLSLQGKF